MSVWRALAAGFLMLFLCGPLRAEVAIYVRIDLGGVPIKIGPADQSEAESRLRALVVGELKDPFKAWNWDPPDAGAALEVKVTFQWDSETDDVSAMFTFPKLGGLVLPTADDKPFIKVSSGAVVAQFTNRPADLVSHLHEKLKPRLVEMRTKWSELFCAKVPVAQIKILQLNHPMLANPPQILLPYKHPNYLWSWFDIRAKQPGVGDVTLLVQGLKTFVDEQLTARIETWMTGKKTIAPPPNAAKILVTLQNIQVFLKTLEPTDPDFQGP